MNRRDFLRLTTLSGATLAAPRLLGGPTPAASLPLLPTSTPDTRPTPPPRDLRKAMVGIPISTSALSASDFERMLDDMQTRGRVNAIFPFIYTHEAHRAGMKDDGFRGGNFAIPHMPYYAGSGLTYADMRAPEAGEADLLDRALTLGHKRGIGTYAWVLEDNHRPDIPDLIPMYERDAENRPSEKHPGGRCFNNPFYKAFTLGLMEDYTRSYPIDGIMWGSERQSGVLDALNFSQSAPVKVSHTTCFCQFCQKKGRDRGIDPERARQGYRAVETFIEANRSGQRPPDGHFTAFWRILLKYPELLAWENLWVTSRHEFQAAIYAKVKSIRPDLPVGWHIWSNRSFSPLQRAEENYAELAPFSDFLRPALYNNCAGERFRNFAEGTHDSLLGDIPPEQALELLYRQLGYAEAPYDKVGATGLSARYVEIETRNAVEGVLPWPTKIWPGVDIDIPVPAGASTCSVEGVKAAVRAVFNGGGQGVILSRNYTEMQPEHLSAAGEALGELGVG